MFCKWKSLRRRKFCKWKLLSLISHEQVAELAHRFWNERGGAHGHHEEDWFRAEQLLRGNAGKLLRGKAS